MRNVISWVIVIVAGLALGYAFPAAATGSKTPPKAEPAPQSQKQDQAQQQAQHQSQSQAAEGGDASAQADAGASAESSAQAGADAYSGGNSLSLSQNHRDRLQAPSVFAPAVYASHACAYGWSAGVSVPGGGISGGRARIDAECNRRELARVLTPLNPQLALRILCADPIAAEVATPEDCTYSPEPDVVRPAVVVLEADKGISRQEVDEKLRRVFESSHGK